MGQLIRGLVANSMRELLANARAPPQAPRTLARAEAAGAVGDALGGDPHGRVVLQEMRTKLDNVRDAIEVLTRRLATEEQERIASSAQLQEHLSDLQFRVPGEQIALIISDLKERLSGLELQLNTSMSEMRQALEAARKEHAVAAQEFERRIKHEGMQILCTTAELCEAFSEAGSLSSASPSRAQHAPFQWRLDGVASPAQPSDVVDEVDNLRGVESPPASARGLAEAVVDLGTAARDLAESSREAMTSTHDAEDLADAMRTLNDAAKILEGTRAVRVSAPDEGAEMAEAMEDLDAVAAELRGGVKARRTGAEADAKHGPPID
eukprot:NODE_1326_length_1175_cov_281.678571.p2 GENE.NODE_1326_length_1175_cov_281.678571~~NODE_1326_length_1175_cov_281.678571.p2  ORF type:complete len:323 (-),score=106.97 NODE_1326_length_1175_cov_281.678571:189-1157(-)